VADVCLIEDTEMGDAIDISDDGGDEQNAEQDKSNDTDDAPGIVGP